MLTRPTLTLALSALLATPALAGSTKTVADFGPDDRLRWISVNDGVMGGVSQGAATRTAAGTLRFAGTISLANNGGFSSVRTRRASLELGAFDGVELKVKGDGRSYYLTFETTGTSWGVQYWAKLKTERGVWKTVRYPWKAFYPVFHGRKLPGPKLAPARIRTVGFMLYDKQAGPFSLEVAHIHAFRGGAATASKPTIVEAAQQAGSFKTLLAAAKAAGLVDALQAKGPLTVFAPTDAAFGQIPASRLRELLKPENKETLTRILRHHVVAGRVGLPDLLAGETVTTLAGQRLKLGAADGVIRIDDGPQVSAAGIDCRNGVVHVIDQVLVPTLDTVVGVAAKAGTFKTLLAAAKAAGLVDALQAKGPLTVFAPTDAAFAKLPEGTVAKLLEPGSKAALKRVLLHHVVAGRITAADAARAGKAETLAGTTLRFAYARGRLRVADVGLTALDVPASNGVVHVVEQVLLPPAPRRRAVKRAAPASTSVAARARKLIETAIERGAPRFNQGNPGACRDIYELTATALLHLRGRLFSSSLREQLRAAVRASGDERADAWKLRRALDAAYAHLASAESAAF